jgi:hypothetical protein
MSTLLETLNLKTKLIDRTFDNSPRAQIEQSPYNRHCLSSEELRNKGGSRDSASKSARRALRTLEACVPHGVLPRN